MKPTITLTASGLLALMLMSCATSGSKYPDQTEDGLQRIDSKRANAVYWREGASLAGYTRVNLEPCEVHFRKNWQRDINRDRFSNPSMRITDEDMERIRGAVSALFHEQFGKALTEAGYALTDERDEDVLLLEPRIIELDVTAPDTSMRSSVRVATYVDTTGEATLNLDFYDAYTNQLIGRAIDRQIADPPGRIQVANTITNRAEAVIIFQRWAGRLVDALNEAKANG